VSVASEGNRYGGQRHGGDYGGTEKQARCVKVARRKVVQGELR